MKICNFRLICVLLLFVAYFANAQNIEKQSFKLDMDIDAITGMEVKSFESGELTVYTTSLMPKLLTKPFKQQLLPDHNIVEFDYICPKGFDIIRVSLGPDYENSQPKLARQISPTRNWRSLSIDISEIIGDWGAVGDYLTIDLGDDPDTHVRIRNLCLRTMNTEEKKATRLRNEKKAKDIEFDKQLKKYLSAEFSSKISKVVVNKNTIEIYGSINGSDNMLLCEVPPYIDITDANDFAFIVPVKENDFSISLDRFVETNGIKYDRLLSKWVIAKRNNTGYELCSHAHYADEISSKYNLPLAEPASKKGLGGFYIGKGPVEDLDDLGITSVTVNIRFATFMYSTPANDRIAHSYNGIMYYFGKNAVDRLDATLQETAKRDIIVAAIILVNKAEQCSDPLIGQLLQHPDMDSAGNYSMPDMTSPESLDCYAAAMDFLASRYSRPDKKYGRIHHWIMHNEVNMASEWSNMGDKSDYVFMDLYIKSMRLCYNIARCYNPHSEVFISVTKQWMWKSKPRFYLVKDLMDILLLNSNAEGDFQWALAFHSYPESLYEPKVWLDKKVQFSLDTQLVTFKNLEVLDAWIKLPEVLYKGKYKRSLWLSENGTNSRTYSEKDLNEQAAGLAYSWKKIERLDGIDAIQWHNWIDSRREYGLRIGLRRFRDDETEPLGEKPVWDAYQAAGTAKEDEVFAPYKEVIGIDNWQQIHYLESIK